MTTASLLTSTAKTFLNMERLQAVLFPHWLLWLIPNIVLALCMIIAATSSHIELIHSGYYLLFVNLISVLVLMMWRYTRFHTFDWFLHRFWCCMMLVIWVGHTTHCLSLLSPLLFAFSFPLINNALASADHALGFDWNAYAHFMYDHTWANFIFSSAYSKLTLGGLLITPFIAILRNDRIRAIQICYLMLATATTCITIAGLLPAYPTTEQIADASILHTIELSGNHSLAKIAAQLHELRDSAYVVFDMHTAEGLVGFPSFHCCMALIIAYCNRGLGLFSWLAYLAGIVIIAATPVYGGHYLVDLIGGGLVTLFFIVIWNRFILQRLSPIMPATSVQDFVLPAFFKRLRFIAN